LLKDLLAIEMLTFVALAGFYFVLTNKARAQLGLGPVFLAILLPPAGFLLPSVWLVYVACIAALPLCVRNRNQIAPLYLFSLFVLPDLGLPQALGTLKLSSVNTSTCFALGALIAAFWRGGLRGKPSILDIPAAVLLTVLVVMNSRSTSATNVLRELLDHVLYFGIPYILLSRLVRTAADFRRIAVALACAGCLLSTLLIAEYIFHWPFFRRMYANVGIDLGSPLAVKFREGNIRATGPFIEATAAAFCLTFAVFATTQLRSAFGSKLYHLAVMGLLIVGVFAPQSRGALLGIAVGFAAIFLYRRSQTVMAALLVGAGVLAVFFVTVGGQPGTSPSAYSKSSETIEYRKRLMTRGMEEFNKSPLTGDSFPNVLENMQDLRQGEGIVDFVNTYLWVALLSGVAGLFFFVTGFGFRLLNLWNVRPRLRKSGLGPAPAAFIFASLAAPVAMLAFTSFGARGAVLIFATFGLSTAVLAAARTGRRPRAVYLAVRPAAEGMRAGPSAFSVTRAPE
jgi:O-antigen ligase